MKYVYDDGGREAAGYKGYADDCVTRAIAIAIGKPYLAVYTVLNELAKKERPRAGGRRSSARNGVFRKTYQRYMELNGWEWISTMGIGTGCRVHLKDGELPGGNLVVRLSRHVTAVIDGVIHDTHDPSRDGSRCVYGYFRGPA